MRFNIDAQQTIMNHLILAQDRDTVIQEIKDSDLWQKENIFEMKILINGVEIEHVEKFEEFLKTQYEFLEREVREKYDADKFDLRVKEAAEKLIKDKFEDLREKMYEFENCLDFGIDDMYK